MRRWILRGGAIAPLLCAMAAFDVEALPIDRAVTIQPIVVCDDLGVDCAVPRLDPTFVDKVYAQAGLDIVFLPTRQLNASRYLTVTVEDTAPTRIDEWRSLLRTPGNQQSSNATTLNLYFVPSIQTVGTAAAGGEAAIAVSFINGNGMVVSNAARIDTLAHEIAHNLGLDHLTFGNNPPDPSNLVSAGGLRVSPTGIEDVFPDGGGRGRLNGDAASGQIQQLRAPLFSVGLNRARVDASPVVPVGGPAIRQLYRFELDVAGTDAGQPLDKLKALFRETAFALETGTAADPSLLALCGGVECWSETRRSLADGTIEITYDFLDGLLVPGRPGRFSFAPSFTGIGGTVSGLVPFSFTFQFANGYSSQAAFDTDALSAASDGAGALTSWSGTPDYGPPIDAIPPPAGISVHLLSEEIEVSAPGSIALLGAAVPALRVFRRRCRTGRRAGAKLAGPRIWVRRAALAALVALAVPLGAVGLPIDRAITIQPITVCDDNGGGCAVPRLDPALIDKIYAQAGIDMVFLPMRQLNASRYLTTTVEDTAPTRIDEWRALLRTPGNQQSSNSTTLNLFFVPTIQTVGTATSNGEAAIGVSFINGNGMVISNAARIDTVAHEIAHNLGLDHLTFGNNPPDPSNLATAGSRRLSPTDIGDVFPDGGQRDRLNGGPASGQIQQLRAPLFSVGLNQARIQATSTAGALERYTLSVSGLDTTKALDKLKVFVAGNPPPGAPLLTLASEALPAFLDRGLCSRATCWTETRTTLADGTTLVTFDFLDGLLRPGLPVDFMFFPGYETPPFGELIPAAPFSFTFEFADGYSSQAAFDIVTRSAASDDPRAITSWLGDPAYGPPAGSLPAPAGFEVHLLADELPVPLPSTLPLLAAALAAAVIPQKRARTP